MQFEELIRYERKEAAEEAAKEAAKAAAEETTERILQLTASMVKAGEGDQIERLQQEPEFLAAMLEKYHLRSERSEEE